MDQIGSPDTATLRQRPCELPCRRDPEFARLDDLDDLTGPETVCPLMRFVKGYAHQLSWQCKAYEYDPSVYMPHASALIGIAFDANL